MRCEECLPLVESFFQGMLDEHDARQVGSHVASCASCSNAIEELQEEQSLYLSYWREANVASPQWGAVMTGIEAERNASPVLSSRNLLKRWMPSFAWVQFNPALVAALLFVCLGIGLLFFINQKSLSPRPELAVVNGDSSAARPARTEEGAGDVSATASDSGRATPVGTPDATRPSAREAEGAEVKASREVAQKSRVQPMRRTQDGSEASLKELSPAETARAVVPVNSNPLPRVEARSSAPASIEVARFEQALSLSRRMVTDSALASNGRSPNMRGEVAQHLERAGLLLLSLKNAPQAEPERTFNVGYEKGLSRRLLTRNVLLRREAESKSNLPLEELLDSIEPVLVEVANLPEQASSSDVLSIRERIRRKGLVALLQTYTNEPLMVATRESF